MKIINSLKIFEKVGIGVLKEVEFSFDIYIHKSQNFEKKKIAIKWLIHCWFFHENLCIFKGF
jgi:hypothetical protein